MEPAPAKHKLSGMVPVARFFSAEEAVEFSRVAAEAGVLAVVADLTRVSPQFDGSLGGFTASEAHTVYAAPADVPPLCAALEAVLSVDPLDPLCALSNDELQDILKAPLHANLTEWALAKKLLATRGPEEDRVRTPAEKAAWAQDAHADADIRLARWLGMVVLGSFGVGVALAVFGATGDFEHPGESGAMQSAAEEFSAPVFAERFTESLKVMIPVVLTVAASLVLTFSWRLLEGAAWRWMFPRGWRALGSLALAFIVGGVVLGLIMGFFHR